MVVHFVVPNADVVRLRVALPRVLEVVGAQDLVLLDQRVVVVDDDGQEERETYCIYADEQEREGLKEHLNGSLDVALAEAALAVDAGELRVVVPECEKGGRKEV